MSTNSQSHFSSAPDATTSEVTGTNITKKRNRRAAASANANTNAATHATPSVFTAAQLLHRLKPTSLGALTALIIALTLTTALSGCIRTQADIQAEKAEAARQQAIQSNLASTEDSVVELRREVGRLEGLIQERDHYRTKDNAENSKMVADLRETVMQLSEKVDNISNVQQALYEEIKKMKEARIKRMQRPSSRRSGGKKKVASERDLGKAAQAKGQHRKAIEYFEAFLKNNPKTRYKHSTNYMMGESLYAIKQYKQAIVAYSVAHELGMKSSWGRKATLRIAQSLVRSGKKTEAQAFAKILIDGAPNSAEAKAVQKVVQ